MNSPSDPSVPSAPARPIPVLMIHNRYRQPGGEDVVCDAQAALLSEHGHPVQRYEKSNSEINSYSIFGKAALYFKTVNNPNSAREISEVVKSFQPQVAHVHNTLPLISPSIYEPLQRAGVKVIQWLHNYRLVCPAGTLFRSGASCSLCTTNGLQSAIHYRCWSNSTMATRALVRMLKKHRDLGTWRKQVDLFIALNEFQKKILVESGGLPEEKILVQPNFSNAPVLDKPSPVGSRGEFLFTGRLTAEKGVRSLLRAMENLRDVPIAIAGDGPLQAEVQSACSNPNHVWLGQIPRDVLRARLESARALIFASEWPEGCPSVILEAMACGKPLIASSVPGATELLQDGQTALFFAAGNAAELVSRVRDLIAAPQLEYRMAGAALARFKALYSPDAGYRNMLSNYARLKITSN